VFDLSTENDYYEFSELNAEALGFLPTQDSSEGKLRGKISIECHVPRPVCQDCLYYRLFLAEESSKLHTNAAEFYVVPSKA
jgi:hypothetical protein